MSTRTTPNLLDRHTTTSSGIAMTNVCSHAIGLTARMNQLITQNGSCFRQSAIAATTPAISQPTYSWDPLLRSSAPTVMRSLRCKDAAIDARELSRNAVITVGSNATAIAKRATGIAAPMIKVFHCLRHSGYKSINNPIPREDP